MRISDWSSDVFSSDLPFEDIGGGNARVEPSGPLIARQRDDLAMMIRCNVRPRVHGEQAKGLADVGVTPDARHAEPAMIFHREQPFIEPLLRLVGRIGEFVETVAEDRKSTRLNSSH